MNRVRGVRSPVGDRTFLGRQGLHDAAQPREHGQSAVLQFLDLQLFQVTRFGQAQRVESTTRGDVTRDESVVKRVGRQASSVRFGTANQDGFDDQNVPEGRVARAFRRPVGAGRLWLPVLLDRFDHRNHLACRCRRVPNWLGGQPV